MATTEPLTGATVYQQSDAPLGGQQAGDVVNDLAPYTVPRFASTGARDAAYNAWTAAGNTMVDGLLCMVGKDLEEYVSGGWQTVNQPSVRGTQFTTGGLTTATSNRPLISIPITVSALDVAAGRRIVVYVRGNFGGANLRVGALIDGVAIDPDYDEIQLSGNTSWFWLGAGSPTAGSHTVSVYFRSVVSGSSVSAGPASALVKVI